MRNSSGKVQTSSPSQCEKCVVDDTASVHTAETRKRLGRWTHVYIRAPVPGNGLGRPSSWESSSRRGKFHPFIGRGRFSSAVFS